MAKQRREIRLAESRHASPTAELRLANPQAETGGRRRVFNAEY